jgi:hypothetical protein
MKLGTSARAIAILAFAGVAAFAVSTAAVSSASTNAGVPALAVKYHFKPFTFTGGVAGAGRSAFTLSFTTSFGLPAVGPGIVTANKTLDNISIAEHVSYPVPAGRSAAAVVGLAQLPFSAQHLTLTVAIKGSCFVQPAGAIGYEFRGSVKCATATLTLGTKSYKASALLKSLGGSFTPPTPATGANEWVATLRATFASPGYTFPVAALGGGGSTDLIIGVYGASALTRSITFSG